VVPVHGMEMGGAMIVPVHVDSDPEEPGNLGQMALGTWRGSNAPGNPLSRVTVLLPAVP
jgi:hypothetical protein